MFSETPILFLQDMSAYVKKVSFKLHESIANNNRGECTIEHDWSSSLFYNYFILFLLTYNLLLSCDFLPLLLIVVSKPPYEVTETGWGEFEIVIKIYFNDPNERPVSNSAITIQSNLHYLCYPAVYSCTRLHVHV